MRRRRREPPPAPPERLCRFVRAEWPGYEHEAEAYSEWTGARFAWWLDHPDVPLPADPREEARKRHVRGESA